jgi:hypothetical protein
VYLTRSGPRVRSALPFTTITLHPNTEALDASCNIVSFGTNLHRAVGLEIVPEDPDGITRRCYGPTSHRGRSARSKGERDSRQRSGTCQVGHVRVKKEQIVHADLS